MMTSETIKISATLTTKELKINNHQFWQAVWILILKPHVVNRNLFGVKVIQIFRCLDSRSLNQVIEKLVNISTAESSDPESSLLNYFATDESFQLCSENDAKIMSEGSCVLVRRLLFKRTTHSNPIEISFINYSGNEALFHNVASKSEKLHPSVLSFVLKFEDTKMKIQVLESSGQIKYDWLNYVLLPKLTKWAEESNSISTCEERNKDSLNLIASDHYNELYLAWKEKYGKELIQKWNESTDPLKFVYEDIAIAAYLCLLWANNKVSFVDLGCGNGLLVHILTQEGHRGYGIDIRSRKIWSTYPASTILKTATITPEDNCFYPDVDWLIGNHSDELTPWIPVFAARSSSRCKFFLLPCCAYQLSGQKFQRRNSSCSTYSDYMDYVIEICEELGFNVSVDRLRIPSTKRICLVGKQESNSDISTEHKVTSVLSKYLKNNFVPREAVERVRNCTKIDRSVTSTICEIISKALIQRQLALAESTDIWSANYSLNFEDAVRLLNPADLKKLKNECGGLQTLLKNNHSVFMVLGGRIYFRKPNEKKHVNKWKSKPCWFYNNHPMKCPLPENKCCFLH